MKSVLSIGIDPSLVDYSAFPGLDAGKVSAGIRAMVEKARELGYDIEACFIDLGETAEAVVAEKLRVRRPDCVLIGAGLRVPPDRLLLFEKIINLVHSSPPQAKVCFNTKPTDSLEAIQRWL